MEIIRDISFMRALSPASLHGKKVNDLEGNCLLKHKWWTSSACSKRLGLRADSLRNELSQPRKGFRICFVQFHVLRETRLDVELLQVATHLMVINVDAD